VTVQLLEHRAGGRAHEYRAKERNVFSAKKSIAQHRFLQKKKKMGTGIFAQLSGPQESKTTFHEIPKSASP
jgi:hypothetical protein